MKIAIIGSRNIGVTLAKIWSQAGKEIIFGLRDFNDPKVSELQDEPLERVTTTSIPQAIKAADWVMLAIPYIAVEDVLQVNASAINGKVIIDTTNRYEDKTTTVPEIIEMYAPKSPVFRAFNAMGWENVANPKFGPHVLDIFYTGQDCDQRAQMETLIADTGGRPIWIGENDLTPVAENLEKLWVTLAFHREMGRRIGFKLLLDE